MWHTFKNFIHVQYFLLPTNLVIVFVHWISTGVLYEPRQCSLFWDYIPLFLPPSVPPARCIFNPTNAEVAQLITLGPHEAGIWAKHPSLTIPAPSRGEPSRHLGSRYQRGGQQTPWLQISAGGGSPSCLHWLLTWVARGVHPCRSYMVTPWVIFKMTRRLVEFWKSLNHNST